MNDLLDAINGLATLLEAASGRGARKTLLVAAFSGISKRGKPINPVAVNIGDHLFLQRPNEPGAGILHAGGPEDLASSTTDGHISTRGAPGRLYATALETLAAGKLGEIDARLLEKRWVVDGNPCAICQENGDAGWIPGDELFPSGDDEPDAHPNCKCDLETRRAEGE